MISDITEHNSIVVQIYGVLNIIQLLFRNMGFCKSQEAGMTEESAKNVL